MSSCKEVVAVAMSGGVDSTVAAYLALQAGYRVIGINLLMEPGKPQDPELLRSCEALGIELFCHDCAKEFYERVLLASAREYDAGRTPNPCCQCNYVLKFHELLRCADRMGVEKVWTGHYVQLVEKDGLRLLQKGVDPGKDQSYFLYRLTQKELSRVGFPLGGMTKSQVREIAAAAALPCAVRKDSQDACFQISGECCGETLRRRCGLPVRSGFFIYQGRKVGRHNGIHRYTLGQRQGLNVALGVPAYIKSICAETGNIVLTTDQDELKSNSFTVRQISWQSGSMPDEAMTVRVRYRSPGSPCAVTVNGDGSLLVEPETIQRAVTPGQAAVFYCGDIVAGGGIIDHV